MRSAVAAAAAFVAAVAASAAIAAPSITVGDTVYGGTAGASVTSQRDGTYVFVQCYQDGRYVYAAYFAVTDGAAEIGPLASTLWLSGAADCVATHGWFTAQGFGVWKEIASTTFHVNG